MNRAKVVDRAWRLGDVRGMNREDFDAGQRARDCANTLHIYWDQVWPKGMPDLPGDDEHSAFLFEWMSQHIDRLLREKPDDTKLLRLRAFLDGGANHA